MRAARISRGIAANIYDKLAVTLVQLMLVPIMATGWGLDTYGVWVLLATIPSFLAFSDLGFASAAGTQMTMAVARGNRDEAVAIMQSACAVIVPLSAAVLVLVLAGCWLVPDAVLPTSAAVSPASARVTLSLLASYGLVALQGSIVTSGFRCEGLFALGMVWTGHTILFENVALGTAVAMGATLPVAAAVLLGGRTLALVAQWLVLRRRVGWLTFGWASVRRETVSALTGPALAVAALPVAQASFLQGTALALGGAAGAAAVPAFTATRTLSRIGLQMTQLVTHALMPEFTAAVAREDRPAQARMLVATLAAAGIVAVPFAVVLVVAGQPLVALWTRGVIHPPQLLMVVMAATVVLGGLWNPLSNLILAMNRHAGFSYPFVVLALLTMPASYALATWIGAAGAGLSIAVLDSAMCVVILRMGRRCFVSIGEARAAAGEMLARGRQMLARRAA
jgi:O-antigen/teichoic acid export membrane protein